MQKVSLVTIDRLNVFLSSTFLPIFLIGYELKVYFQNMGV